jgi:Caspase domain
VGRLPDHGNIAAATFTYADRVGAIALDANGQFEVQIELEAHRRALNITAVDHNKKVRNKTIPVAYSGDAEEMALAGDRYALVIGIKQYDHWSPLETPDHDAKAVAEVLRNLYGFKTEFELENRQKQPLLLIDAKLDDIQRALENLRKRLTENDSLLIYFAGHGQYLGDAREAYWVPRDGEKDNHFTWFGAPQIITTIKRMIARSVLVVSDSCFSGAILREPPDITAFDQDRRRALIKAGTRKSRIFISSGGTEPVLDAGCDNHSIFACAFIKALRDAKEPIISSGELHHMYLLPNVSGKAQQQPERKEIRDSNSEGGDFVFAQVGAEAAAKGKGVFSDVAGSGGEATNGGPTSPMSTSSLGPRK